jgi:aminopeptidase N
MYNLWIKIQYLHVINDILMINNAQSLQKNMTKNFPGQMINKTKIFKLFILISLSFFSTFEVYNQKIYSGGPIQKNQSVFDVKHYHIFLDVNIDQKSFSGTTTIKIDIKDPTEELALDLLNVYGIEEIWSGKISLNFRHENNKITIIDPLFLKTGIHEIKVVYRGIPPVALKAPWQGGIQWEKDDNGNPWIALTCQNEGAKVFFPCKDHPGDKPDEGAVMVISVPKGLKVAGPGILIKEENKGKKSVFTWKTTYPIHNYSLVFNIAKYEIVTRNYTTINGNTVPMVYYVLPENLHRAEKHLDILAKSVSVQEKYFGEYPFFKEKIGLAETPHLGMEHQTMNAYGNKYRYTKLGGEDFDWLLYHELGHEWWANKVSNKDWAHFWIQEGICVLGDWLYYREKEGIDAYHIQATKARFSFVNKYPLVRDSIVNSVDAYHPDIYGKGAFFMRSLSFIIGEENFFKLIKSFIGDDRYTYANTVTTSMVENHFSKGSEFNLKPYFDFFLKTTERLEIRVKEVRPKEYDISFINYNHGLPLEIQDGSEIKKINVSEEPVRITLNNFPLIDPTGYYFKRVVYE